MLLIVHTVELKLFHSIRKKPRLSAETLVASISEDVDFTDFTLVSKNGDKFPVPRNVLAAQSNVLRRIFLTPEGEEDLLYSAPVRDRHCEEVHKVFVRERN